MLFNVVASLAFLVGLCSAGVGHPSYMAVIDEVLGTNSKVSGMVAVFSDNQTNVGFSTMLQGLEPNLVDCPLPNGCGVHIHSGTDCFDADSQGEHYFVGGADPWTEARYKSDQNGTAYASGVINIGTDALLGRAVVGKYNHQHWEFF